MCGIAAIVAPSSARFTAHMERMVGSLSHRGPDGHGLLALNSCLLGHARLSIMDIDGGAQPMCSSNAAVVFNGEIYDWREQAANYDYPFRTKCDTEILLAAYSKYGTDMCEHLKGMFAFALWDEAAGRLVCGRDRFGEKPLYYAKGRAGEFIVASEIKSILASGLISPHVDRRGLSAYLRLGYVPEKESIFREIRQLPPGYVLTLEDGKETARLYWRKPAPLASPPDMHECASELARLLDQAVARCLISDVEVGILLSGGLDSTTVAGIAAQKGTLRAFSFGMSGARNELPFARCAAASYGLPLEESYLENLDYCAVLRELPQIYDEPLADTSCLPTLLLCRHAASRVKAVLGGDGGDELLGGYSWYRKLDEAAAAASGATNGWSRHAMAHFQRRSCCSSQVLREAGLEPWFPEMPEHLSETVDDAFRMDVESFLPADVLKKTDRAAMRFGLELRSPFLDADVADFLLSLPPPLKVGNGGNKLVLHSAFEGMWPDSVRNRAKQGFGMDCAAVMTPKDVACLRESIVNGDALRSILPGAWLGKYGLDSGRLGWNIFILGLWCVNMREKGFLGG